jgi:hypothetical protein
LEKNSTTVSAWLDNLFSKRTAEQSGRQNPVMLATVERSGRIYGQIPLGDMIDEATKDELSRRLYLEINVICNAIDPVVACRDRLAVAMMKFASYQVLVIPPAPEPDPSGLRSQPGITGELKAYLVDIAKIDFDLRSKLYGVDEEPAFDVVWQAVLCAYWQAHWFLETFNAARLHLGDATDPHDWYPSFRHAACAGHESKYRGEIGLPSAFDDDIASAAATAYAIYTDIVLAGAEDPDREWREYHAGSNIPVPVFN